jgi:cytochrome P450
MVTASDLELYNLPIGEQRFADGPDAFMLAARETHPWLATSEFGLVITDYDAVTKVKLMDDVLKPPAAHVIEIMGAEGTDWARFERECLIGLDGSVHERVRNAVNAAFTPRAVNQHVARIRGVISDLLDEWAPKGQFDFGDFASRFPVAVMFGLLGIPRERIEKVKHLLEVFGQSFGLDRNLFPAINEAYEDLKALAEERVAIRMKNAKPGTPDLLDALVEAEISGKLSHVEVIDMILFLFAGGYDTSKNQLGHIMHLLLDRLEIWERCANDRRYCDDVMEEALRHSGVATTYRHVAKDFEYDGVTIPAGSMLIFPLSIICRYSGPFETPAEFIPGRANGRRHTVFGRGAHICIGQFLARLQIAEGLHLMAQRLKSPRRGGEMTWRPFPGVWGPLKLPIVFDAAA